MRIIFSVLFIVFGFFFGSSQISNVKEELLLPTMPVNLSESSGAIFFNDKLITHTDILEAKVNCMNWILLLGWLLEP